MPARPAIIVAALCLTASACVTLLTVGLVLSWVVSVF